MEQWIIERLSCITEEEKKLLAGEAVDRELYTGDGRAFVVEAGKFLSRESQIDIRPHTRFVDFPPHRHNYIEMIYMCRGQTRHRLDKDELLLREGEILILNQKVLHSIKRAERDDIALNFLIRPNFFDFTLELIGGSHPLAAFLMETFRQNRDVSSYLHFNTSESVTVQNLMENIIIHLLEPKQLQPKLIKVSAALLLMELMNHSGSLAATKVDKKALITARALQEIEENYLEPNLSSVAEQYGLSPAYVSSLIKKETGLTFSEHLENKRLTLAVLYLTESELSVDDIIYAIGYSNSSYFYKIFKRRYGLTPNQYRQKHRAEAAEGGRG